MNQYIILINTSYFEYSCVTYSILQSWTIYWICYPRRTAKVMFSSLLICVSVCLSVSNIVEKTRERIVMFFFRIDGTTRNNLGYFGMFRWTPSTQAIFLTFSGESVSVSNNLEHFRDVAVNPFNPGCFSLFSKFVIVGDILEKQTNGFSWNFHEMSETTHKMIS